MSGPLSWELLLKDSFSPSAKKAGASILKLQKAFDEFHKACKAQGDEQERLNKLSMDALTLDRQRTTQARKLSGQLDKVLKSQDKLQKHGSSPNKIDGGKLGGLGGVASLASKAAVGVAAIAGAAYGAAKAFSAMASAAKNASLWAIDRLQFKESTLATMEILLGDRKSARGMFSSAMKIAGQTPFSASTVAGAYQKLLGAGFSADQVGSVFQGIGDVAAMNGFDASVIDRMADTFAQIKGRGKFVTEEMKQAFNAGGGVITIKGIYDEIAKSMNLGADEVEKAMQRGEVAASTGINAILKVIQKKSGGKVGGAMMKQSKTLGGLLSTIRDIPSMMLFGMDLDSSKGFGALKGMLQNIIGLFDTTTERGRDFQQKFVSIFDKLWKGIFEPLTGPDGLKKLENAAKTVMGVFDVSLKTIEGFGNGLLTSLGIDTGKEMDWEKLGEKFKKAGETFGKVVGGVVEILIWGAGKLETVEKLAVSGPAGVAASEFNDTVERGGGDVKILRGANSRRAEGGIVSAPEVALLGEEGPEAVIPLKASHGEGLSSLRGLGGGVTVNVSLSVDARGNAQGDDIAQRIAMALPSALADALEGIALECGGTI